jgi:SET domain-containing protein
MAARSSILTPRIDPRHARFRLTLRPSAIHGWGVYAAEPIPAGRKVIEYTGERIGRREARRRGLGSRTYLFTLDDYWTLDGSVGGSGAELINHSCDPNLYSWIFKGHILYMSKRDILPGEELTVDYHFSSKIDRVPCRCGSAKCRGTINLPNGRLSKS